MAVNELKSYRKPMKMTRLSKVHATRVWIVLFMFALDKFNVTR